MLKRLFFGLLGLVLLLALALAVNTWRQGSRQVLVQPLAVLAVDKDGAAQSLAAAVRARTMSGLLDPAGQALAFEQLHQHLKTRYPLLHQRAQREVVGGQTLVYTLKGSDAAAKPIAWLAHQDVVPIAPGTEGLWKQAPFDGVVCDGFVWGRGAWDNKGNLIAQLEGSPEMAPTQRVVLGNLWLFRPLAERMLGKAASTNAMMRTTTALTIVNAGNKDNVLPGRAEAIVNFRILPGDTVGGVLALAKRVVADDRIEIKPLPNASPASRV